MFIRAFFKLKMFKSKVLFLSKKKVYLSRSSCFDKVMTQILYPKIAANIYKTKFEDIEPNVRKSKKGGSVNVDFLCGGAS